LDGVSSENSPLCVTTADGFRDLARVFYERCDYESGMIAGYLSVHFQLQSYGFLFERSHR
jgi:hypothetical protein